MYRDLLGFIAIYLPDRAMEVLSAAGMVRNQGIIIGRQKAERRPREGRQMAVRSKSSETTAVLN